MRVVNIVFDAYYPPVTATEPNPVLQEAERSAQAQRTLLELCREQAQVERVLRRMEQDVLAQRRLRAKPDRFRGDGI